MSVRASRSILAAVAALGVALAQGASIVQNQHPSADPYLWLEDVHGAKPLAWVETQNARARAVLQRIRNTRRTTTRFCKELDDDRIPYGTLGPAILPQFLQDAEHEGIVARTSVPGYATSGPPNSCWTSTSSPRTSAKTGYGRARIARPRSSIACSACRAEEGTRA
jgi:prolyl oligopeptidase